MKWIKFSDMRPPIGMNIFVSNGRGEVNILQWISLYNTDCGEFISMFGDVYECPRDIYDLEHWAPVHFFNKYLPSNPNGELKPRVDWYLKHKKHTNIENIKSIVEDLNAKTTEELWNHVKTDYGSSAYVYFKIREVISLMKEINENKQTS